MSTLQTKPATIFAFDSVEVSITPNNTKLIEWRLNSKFEVTGSVLQFYVEVSRAAGEWTRLNEVPITDICIYVDTAHYRCNLDNDIFYRIILSDGTNEYASVPAATLGVWNLHDLLIARDIVRKEYLVLKKYNGIEGYLLKRREHGTKCPSCRDWDVDLPANSHCEDCFGTGFTNGYYNAIPYYVSIEGVTSSKDVNEPFGTMDLKPRTGRCVAYPRLGTYDIWIDNKNKRYLVRGVTTLVEIKGKPLVYSAVFHELPVGRVEYSVPLEQTPPSSSTQGGWTSGIAYMKEW